MKLDQQTGNTLVVNKKHQALNLSLTPLPHSPSLSIARVKQIPPVKGRLLQAEQPSVTAELFPFV